MRHPDRPADIRQTCSKEGEKMARKRNRYVIRMTYADGSPGIAFHATLTGARKAAQEPLHGGRPVAEAEVCEWLSNGAFLGLQVFHPQAETGAE
jgi:hypothetical protein